MFGDMAWRDDHRDRAGDRDAKRGLLNKIILEPNKIARLYTPIKDKCKFATVHFNIANSEALNPADPNDGSTAANIQIWVSDQEVPGDVDIIEPNIILRPGEVFSRFGDLINEGEYVYMRTTGNSIIVRITGVEDRLP